MTYHEESTKHNNSNKNDIPLFDNIEGISILS